MADNYTDKTLKLADSFRVNQFSENLYFLYYTQIMKKYAPSGDFSNFRLLFNLNSRILSIHYLLLETADMSGEEFLLSENYAKNFISNDRESIDSKPGIFLKRNKKRIKRKDNIKLLKNNISHKIVIFIYKI